VEYFLGPDSSLCIVAADGAMKAIPLRCSAADVARAVSAFRAPMAAPASLATMGFDAAAAREIRRLVFDPVESSLHGATRVIVVPDGALHACPFEALILSGPGDAPSDTVHGSFREAEFLGDRLSFRYLPSADLLVPGRPRPPMTLGDVVAFGGPAAEIGDPDRVRGRAGDGAGPANAPRNSDREARAIASLFPNSTVRVGRDATERAFKELSPRFRTVHVATHGLADDAAPLYSFLQLARGEDGGEDGSLHAYEVLDIPLRCDLVTLSACETGLGKLYAGEGVLGLPRAFLYAGARQVVASLWKVDDASSAILMEGFYANRARGLDEAEALAEARRSLKQIVAPRPGGATLSYAHPFFWAPFVLIGAPAPPAAGSGDLARESAR
jgi:CHAT domain-containing protein